MAYSKPRDEKRLGSYLPSNKREDKFLTPVMVASLFFATATVYNIFTIASQKEIVATMIWSVCA
jgi:hypothetical protein